MQEQSREPTAGQGRLTPGLRYNKVLTVSGNALNTVLESEAHGMSGRRVVIGTPVAAPPPGPAAPPPGHAADWALPLPGIMRTDQIAQR